MVAISYYAVSLATYALAPAMAAMGVSKVVGTALLVPIVVLAVWLFVRRVRRHLD